MLNIVERLVKEMVKKEIYIVLITIFFIFLISSIVSAGIFDWFKKVTGYASTSQPTNVSITVAGTNRITMTIFNQTLTGSTVDPTENATTYITFYVVINDSDGVSDINDSSVRANVTFGTTVRSNNTCSLVGDLDTQRANYSCRIDMWYFDAPETWTINVRANDLGNTSYVVNTSTFKYNQLQAIVVSPNSLTWPSISIGATNQTSDNDPTVLNNTGNYNVTNNNVRVTAIDLYGQTTATERIFAGNFSARTLTGSSVECAGTNLVNGTATGVSGANITRGNHSLNDGATGQEQLYYCITKAPTDISSQTYSTTNAGSWTVSIA